MALRRYSISIFNACKNSRIGIPRNPIQEPVSKTAFSCKPSTIPALQKRFYFKNREHEVRWFHNPKRVGAVTFLFSCGVATAVTSGDWVTVPYSGRTHFILFHKFMKKMFQSDIILFEDKTVLPNHPYIAMAQRIFQDIIDQALPLETEVERKLDKKAEIIVVDWHEGAAEISGPFGKMYVTTGMLNLYREHEAMIATYFGQQVGQDLARHPEERLSKFIGTVSVIGMSVYLFWQSTYVRSKMPSLVKFIRHRNFPSLGFGVTVWLLSYLPLAKNMRKTELEADYIGLMLAASAGYDPEEGLMYPVYKAKITPPLLPECFYCYPTYERKFLSLSHPNVLSEAVSRYRQAQARSSTKVESS